MTNNHQDMFLATSAILQYWKERGLKCQFSLVRDRTDKKNHPSQGPSQGTQRVWMSSQMLYGQQHCNVIQLLPIQTFGTLTVLHVPNKNYRRVGKYNNRTFSDGSEVFHAPHETILTDMELHIALRKFSYDTATMQQQQQQQQQQHNEPKAIKKQYHGKITMMDDRHRYEISFKDEKDIEYIEMIHRRMKEYENYVDRRGILSHEELQKTLIANEL